MGLEGLPEKEAKLVFEGNRLAAVCVKIVSWCIRRSTPVAVENPDLSYIWAHDDFTKIYEENAAGSPF